MIFLDKDKIVICSPSYRRPVVKTLEYLPDVRIYIDKSDEEDYRRENPHADIVVCDDGVQGNVARVRNYILDKEFGNGAKAVCLVDDDMSGIFEWVSCKKRLVKRDEFKDFLYKYSIIAEDMGVYFWGVNINQDKQTYREYSPFSFLNFVGGPFQVFINNGGGLRYDERLPLKEDYDMTLQQLNKYRRVLRVNKFFYIVKQSTNAGGCASYRTIEREMRQLEDLQRKWGKNIVKIDKADRSHNLVADKSKHFDYNPIIRVPIKGI